MELSPEIISCVQSVSPFDYYEEGALNLEKVAKLLNVQEITLVEFQSDNVSGLLKKLEGDDCWAIYVNASDSPRRRRFTIAHEIGHLISYKNGSKSKASIDSTGKISDYAFAARTAISDAVEVEANAIAAMLLMPEDFVIRLYNEGKTVEEMADYFQVSESAMLVRLYDKNISAKINSIPFESQSYDS